VTIDQCRNLPDYPTYFGDVEFEVTEKLEGTSISAYYHDGKFGMAFFIFFLLI
jgi:NAD-dependent DNA ligase